jgi:hypothetical protein
MWQYNQMIQPETNDNNQSMNSMNRDNLALFYNRFKSNNLHNIGQHTIRNYIVNKDTYTGRQNDFYPAGDRYDYTTFDRVSGDTININFDKKNVPHIKNMYDIVKLGQFRLFVNKGLDHKQILNLINLINKYGPKRVGYALMGDSIVLNTLNYQDKMTLASLPADYD